MGTGTTLDGEGHERTNSVLSRSIASTRFETAGNRQQDIAWLLEYNNRKKEEHFIPNARQAASTVFVRLHDTYTTLNGRVGRFVRCHKERFLLKYIYSYVSNVVYNNTLRKDALKNIALSKERNPPESALRADIATDIRAIVNLERLLKSKIGTTKASKMRKRVKTLRSKVDGKIGLVQGMIRYAIASLWD